MMQHLSHVEVAVGYFQPVMRQGMAYVSVGHGRWLSAGLLRASLYRKCLIPITGAGVRPLGGHIHLNTSQTSCSLATLSPSQQPILHIYHFRTIITSKYPNKCPITLSSISPKTPPTIKPAYIQQNVSPTSL